MHVSMKAVGEGVGENKKLAWRGQRPDSTLKREDLPQPFGPITSTERPVGTSKVSSLTSGVPSGAFRATLHCTLVSACGLQHTLLTDESARWQNVGKSLHPSHPTTSALCPQPCPLSSLAGSLRESQLPCMADTEVGARLHAGFHANIQLCRGITDLLKLMMSPAMRLGSGRGSEALSSSSLELETFLLYSSLVVSSASPSLSFCTCIPSQACLSGLSLAQLTARSLIFGCCLAASACNETAVGVAFEMLQGQ